MTAYATHMVWKNATPVNGYEDHGESVEAGGSDEWDFRSGGIAALIQLKMGGG
jgi:hypothetical protein